MNRISVQIIAVAVAGVASIATFADVYTWTNAKGDGDWTKPGNFTLGRVSSPTGAEEPATVCPGSADTVVLPIGCTVVLEYDTSDATKRASCEAFASIYKMTPYANSTIDITVPEGETLELSCSIARGTSEPNHDTGTIVKRGGGELFLKSKGRTHSGGTYYDYYCAITVENGVIRFPQESVGAHYAVGDVTLAANATLFTARTGSTYGMIFYSLHGSGTITNDCASPCRMQVQTFGDFSGRMGGNIDYYSSGRLRLTGTESTFLSTSVYGNEGRGVGVDSYGSIEVTKFGLKPVADVNTPSSIGYSDTILVRGNAAAILYLGNGETTDKDLRFWPDGSSYPLYLDGGAHGGLVWTGLWGHRNVAPKDYDDPAMLRLVLQGSNTEECVMSGKIELYTKGTTNYTYCITKAGTGTWRMAHNDTSQMQGVWRVVDGTLRYDTIGPAGVNTALGSSTMLYADVCGVPPLDENRVDYAFWLGGGEAGPRASLEYVGETNCVATSRRFALNGEGAVLNNGIGFLRFSDFYATNTASTLVLGGSNTLENVADGIADGGNAMMSVVKEGSGTWRLGGNCTFTGALDVRGGRLVLGNAELYRYYRWVIRATYSRETGSSANRVIGLRSFGLFDDEGNDRVYALSHEGYWYSEAHSSSTYYCGRAYSSHSSFCPDLALEEGHFQVTTYGGAVMKFTTGGHEAVTNLFAHMDYNPNFWSRSSNSRPPYYEDDTTWVTFTMRPKSGTPITSWDYANDYYNQAYQMISNCLLEASVDGVTWTRLQEITNDTRPTKGKWQSDNTTAYEVGYTTHTTGMPIPPGPTNKVAFAASPVSVAAGAELVAHAPEKPVINALTVDGTAGGGTIDGFAFASSCELNIVNPPSDSGYDIPMTFVNVTGLESSKKWLVSVGGVRKVNLRVGASANGLSVYPVGMRLILR